MSPVVPAELAFAGDGTPFSPAYGDIYHSSQGGLDQARHVFLGGNDLPARWLGRDSFSILETGFGLGLNFLATWQAWKAAGEPCRLHFISVEKHPFHRDDLATLLARFPELAIEADELLRQWPPLTPGFHRLHFGTQFGQVTLTLLFGDALELLPRLTAQADAIYLDGFAPSKNPELWSPDLLATITRLAAPGASLATWSVVGELRRGLENLGWQCERRRGFSFKREMLVAQRKIAVPPAPTFQPASQRRALVIGAGLAGAAVAEALARRHWQVDILERHAAPAQEASGNPAGVLLPLPAKDDAIAARLSRACYLYALRRLADLPDVRWSPCGVLQLARDAAHETLQRATVESLQLPPDFAAFLDRADAAALIGHALPIGGWWFPSGGWVQPQSFCAALLAAGGERIRTHFGIEIVALRPSENGWQAIDAQGKIVAIAPHVILANAYAANALLPHPLPLEPIRGQISILPPPALTGVRHVICRDGYLTPPTAGTVCVGASFDRGDTDLTLRVADHAGNLRRLEEILPGAADGIDPATLDGRAGLRTATRDRLPLIGTLADTMAIADGEPALATLPRRQGLHGLLGLGARGMVWAPLAAELLAAQLNGEPLPLERELVTAVDPARFHLRALRRGKAGL